MRLVRYFSQQINHQNPPVNTWRSHRIPKLCLSTNTFRRRAKCKFRPQSIGVPCPTTNCIQQGQSELSADVFDCVIIYRWSTARFSGKPMAYLMYYAILATTGKPPFLDDFHLAVGNRLDRVLKVIGESKVVVLLLQPGDLERCHTDCSDFLLGEITEALSKKIIIVLYNQSSKSSSIADFWKPQYGRTNLVLQRLHDEVIATQLFKIVNVWEEAMITIDRVVQDIALEIKSH
jgi:hypothetical protein